MEAGKTKSIIVAVIVTVTAFVTFLSNLNSASEFFTRVYHSLFAGSELNVSVINARLIPVRPRADIPTLMDDDAFVALQLRNYGKAPVLLTSAVLTLLHTQHASTRGSTGGGRCMLSADPDKNRSPVMLEPGQTKWVAAAMALRFDGLLKSLSGTEFDSLYVAEAAPGVPYIILHSGYVETFNAIMARRYGAQSAVRVTLKINLDEDELNFTLPLTTGGDISTTQGGRFQQDWFLAHLKKPTMIPYVNLSDEAYDLDEINRFLAFDK